MSLIVPGFETLRQDRLDSVIEYSVYLDATFALAKSLVFHQPEIAEDINKYITEQYGILPHYDKSKWKYYLNISGEYYDTDKVMSVRSLDTLEWIPFTKEMLKKHSNTAKAYRYDSNYYRSLLTRYPEQEMLLLGILYPADIQVAINSGSYTILSYPTHLVEPYEQTLLIELEQVVKDQQSRWHNKQYIHGDILYSLAQQGILYTTLPLTLLNLRLKRMKTDEVHTFHLSQYLASNFYLNKYMPYMTRKQQMFLYKNIKYLNHHSGQSGNLDWLIERLLTERQIPISEYSIRHTDEYTDKFQHFHFRRKPINTQFNTPEKDYYSLEEMYEKEKLLAPNNINVDTNKVDKQIQLSQSGVIQTKELGSDLYDYSNSEPYKLEPTLLSHWGYLVSTGKYNAYAMVTSPTGDEFVLSAEDAFVFTMYVMAKCAGTTLSIVPSYNCERLRVTDVSLASIKSVIPERTFSDATLTALLNSAPMITEAFSTDHFHTLVNNLHQAMLRQWKMYSSVSDRSERGYLENAVHRLYIDKTVSFSSTGKLYEDWLVEKGIPNYQYSNTQWTALYKALWYSGTGHVVDETKLIANIHKAMISVLTTLSSYSIQVIRSTNETPVTLIDWPVIRAELPNSKISANVGLQQPLLVTDYNGKLKDTGAITFNSTLLVKSKTCSMDHVLIPKMVRMSHATINHAHIPNSRITVWSDETCTEPDGNYLSLSAEDASTIPDVYKPRINTSKHPISGIIQYHDVTAMPLSTAIGQTYIGTP